MSRDVRDRHGNGLPDDPRSRWVGVRSRAVGLAVIASCILGGVLAGCGGGTEGSSVAGSTTVSTGQAGTDSGPASGLSAKTQRELHQLDRKLKVPKTPAQQVRGVVTAVLRLGGAFTCGPHLVTSRYVKAAYGNRQGCVKAAQSHAAVAEKLQFKSVRVDGSTATAVVIPSGGIYDGERITVSLVSSTGSAHWAVDALDSNVPVGP